MDRFQDRQVLTKILQESIVQMCKVSVGVHNNTVTIDGIICIGNNEDDREIVVKIHEQIDRSSSDTSKLINSGSVSKEKTKDVTFKQQYQAEEIFIEKSLYQERPQFLQSHSSLSDKDFIFHDDNELFGDITAIKAITPLNRNDTLDTLGQQIPPNSVVNLIDEETVSYSEAERAMGIPGLFSGGQNQVNSNPNPTTLNENALNVMIKPDPGPSGAALIMQESALLSNSSCSVTSVLDSRPIVSLDASLTSALPQLRTTTEDSDDDDLKIEKLKAGRVRKHRRINSESGPLSPEPGSNSLVASVCDQSGNVESTLVQAPSNTPMKTINILGTITQSPPVKVVPSKATNQLHTQKLSGIDTVINNQSSQSPDCSISPETELTLKCLTSEPKTAPVETIKSSVNCNKTAVVETGMSVAHQLELLRSGVSAEQVAQRASRAASQEDHANVPFAITGTRETFRCIICNTSFQNFKQYHLHMFKIHAAFPCPCCDKMFKHRVSRNRHIVTHHAGKKTFSCPFCKKGFVRADTLKLHLTRSHPGSNYKVNFSYCRAKQMYEADTTSSSVDSKNKDSLAKQSAVTTVTTDSLPSESSDTTSEAADCSLNLSAIQSEDIIPPVKSGVPQEPEVVFNKNLPQKFEVESDNSSDATIYTRRSRSASNVQAAVVSRSGPCYVIPGMATLTYLSDTVNAPDTLGEALMGKFEEGSEDIMDMIEISDEEMENH